ncbi:MAG: ABC transporter ATP-binding protein [Bacteroidota bacterium]
MPLIEMSGVTREYGHGGELVKALRGVDLEIEEGEFAAVMGPSGSGKSTLLTILGGLGRPSAGRVAIDGIELYELSPESLADFRREYIGFVFQQFQLIPYLTAVENVELPLIVAGMNSGEQRRMALEALARVGLAGKAGRLPNQLSGGEQERVAIARAIVNRPPMVLADEPTGNLDSATGEEVMRLFQTLNDEGLTLIMVTHSSENAGYARRLIRIRDGLVASDAQESGRASAPVSSVSG